MNSIKSNKDVKPEMSQFWKDIKLVFLAIPLLLLWILIFILTLKWRNEYMIGEMHGGAKVTETKTDLFGTDYKYTYSKKNSKDYPTWRDFWSKFGYCKPSLESNEKKV